MSDSRYSQALDGPTLTYARCNRDIFDQLPAPDDGPWTANEVFENPQVVYRLRQMGIIERTGDRAEMDNGHHHRTYRTRRDAYQALDEHDLLNVDRPPLYGSVDISCPECGRVSFVNVDGDRLRCKQCNHIAPKEDWR